MNYNRCFNRTVGWGDEGTPTCIPPTCNCNHCFNKHMQNGRFGGRSHTHHKLLITTFGLYMQVLKELWSSCWGSCLTTNLHQVVSPMGSDSNVSSASNFSAVTFPRIVRLTFPSASINTVKGKPPCALPKSRASCVPSKPAI